MAATADAPDDRADPDGSSLFYGTWLDWLIIGLLATALVFVPFAQVLGGGVAGYLSDRSATLDGALAGVVFGAPGYVVWLAAVAGTLAAGFVSAAFFVLFAMLVYLVIDVLLAAAGGLVAGFFAG